MDTKHGMNDLFEKVKKTSKQAAQKMADVTSNAAATVKDTADSAMHKAEIRADEKKKAAEEAYHQQYENAVKTLRENGFEDFLESLNESPLKLTAIKITQIKALFTIPKEQYILWADAEFDLHPSGIVITDYGIFIRTNVETMDGKLGIGSQVLDDMDADEQEEYLEYFKKFRTGKAVILKYSWADFDPAHFTGNTVLNNEALLVEEKCSKRFIDCCRKYTGVYPESSQQETSEEKQSGAEQENKQPVADADEKGAAAKKDKEPKTKLDDELREAVMKYNDAYTRLDANGNSLYVMRTRSVDLIENIEELVNSIANHPKTFDTDIAEIHTERVSFTEACEFARAELEAAKKSALGAGAGAAAGAAIVSVAPAAAMWIATTFGTASTGTAISALSGAAAQSAALAWLGGGALTAGGGGMAVGHALLALAGPIGWTVAGATLLASITLFTVNKFKLNKQKIEEIEAVKANTNETIIISDKIQTLIDEVTILRDKLSKLYGDSLNEFGKDFLSIPEDRQAQLGILVNNTKALAASLSKGIE